MSECLSVEGPARSPKSLQNDADSDRHTDRQMYVMCMAFIQWMYRWMCELLQIKYIMF